MQFGRNRMNSGKGKKKEKQLQENKGKAAYMPRKEDKPIKNETRKYI